MIQNGCYIHAARCKPGSIVVIPTGWVTCEGSCNNKSVCGLTIPVAFAGPFCVASFERLARPIAAFVDAKPAAATQMMKDIAGTLDALKAKVGEELPDVALSVLGAYPPAAAKAGPTNRPPLASPPAAAKAGPKSEAAARTHTHAHACNLSTHTCT